MTQNWHQIWNRRGLTEETPHDLQRLMEIDGYDSGAGRLAAADFRQYLRAIAERLGIADGSSVYEVGCGAGAFLFGLRERYDVRVGGCDYAPALVSIARRLFPTGDMAVAEAADISTVPKYDITVANGVFHYFPNLDYAQRALALMIAKAVSAVAILEVPNADTHDEAERVRRDQLTQELYEERYRGLEHRYYLPQWFGEIAKKYECDWECFDHPAPNYAQSRFRFDVIIRKPKSA